MKKWKRGKIYTTRVFDSELIALKKCRCKNGGDDGTRTRDLCRDRAAF
jgi:hypothetical protein